jgi:hypothetical protein
MRGAVTCISAGGHEHRTSFDALLTADRREAVREAAANWIKRLRLVRYGDETMRERFRYRGDSLWWFTEIYLHKMRRLETAIAAIAALDAAITADAPARLLVHATDPVVREATTAFGAARRLPVDFDGTADRAPSRWWTSRLVKWSASLSRVRSRPRPAMPQGARVAAFVHTAFWRAGRDDEAAERYVGPILDALRARIGDAITYVGVGPRRNFRARRWWDPVVAAGGDRPRVVPVEQLASRAALHDAFALWEHRDALAREITAGPSIREAAVVDGCDLWPVLSRELEDAARVQWTWSARAMDEAGAAIDVLAPDVVLTYAEAGGWGRAIVLEARRRGVPSAGAQHGFIYRHWLNYRHEPDEIAPRADGDAGFPHPTKTLVFDRYAAADLERRGHLPAASIEVTGSPTLDALAARVRAQPNGDRAELRRTLSVPADGALAVLAAKFTEIKDELPSLFAAVAARPSLRLVVKTHPAETPDGYRTLAVGISNISVAGADADLAQLIGAANAIITMNSTVAIDGLVLGVPALVVGLPNNLTPFVDAGAMRGADRDSVGEALDALLYDRQARADQLAAAARFVSQFAMRADGGAAGRAAEAILALMPADAAPARSEIS